MKVLILNAYFQPEQIAFTHLEKDILDAFVSEGFQIDVITPIPTRGIDDEIRRKYKNNKYEELYDGAVRIHRFWAPKEVKNPIIRAFRYIWCNLREYQLSKHFLDTDILFCPSTPPTQGWMAGKVKKFIRKNGNKSVGFVYNLQDIFPDSLVNAGMTNEGSMIWRIGRKIENKTYKEVDRIITISESFKRNLINKGVNKEKVEVIPNWIDTSEVFDILRVENKLIKKYGLDPNKFYICYSGNIGHSQNLDLLVKAAKDIAKITEQIEFVIIGEGAAKDQLKQMVEESNLSNIHLFPFQPYEDIAHVFSLGDVGLIISKPGIGKSSVPSKTWSIMAARRPVLASFDTDGELARVIHEAKCGIIVEPDDKGALIEAITSLYSVNSKDMGDRGRKYVLDNLNREACTRVYSNTLIDVYSSNHS